MDYDAAKTVRFLDHVEHGPEGADVAFLPLPYEATVSYVAGTALGPAAILEASHQLEEYEEDLGWEPTNELKLHTAAPLVHVEGEPTGSYIARVAQAAGALSHVPMLVGLGGEHSVTAPLVFSRIGQGGTFIVIDAHPDLRESYLGDKLSHASVTRRVTEAGIDVLQIGTGCNTAEEDAYARSLRNFTRFTAEEAASAEGFGSLLKFIAQLEGPVYLSIDCDGLCTSIMPGVGTPVPGGLTWHRLVAIARTLWRNPAVQVRGLDVVELRPLPDSTLSEFTAAKFIQKCISYGFHEIFKK